MSKRRGAVIWPVVHNERRALIRDLEDIDAESWLTPSLCRGWDVHDVLAHMIDSATTTRMGFMRRMIAAKFDFDQETASGLARMKREDPVDTLADFRAEATSRATPPAPLATRLVEAYAHGEDIRRPLGMSGDYEAEHVATALDYLAKTSAKMGGGRERASGWRFVATDTEYQHGEGPEVHGQAISLLLAVSGRPVDADELTGPGAAEFFSNKVRKSR